MTAPAPTPRPAAAAVAFLLASALLLAAATTLPAQETPSRSAAIKAAFLPKIADFTTWPPASPSLPAPDPILIGVLAPDPEGIADNLESLIAASVTAQGRPLRVIRLPAPPSPSALAPLHILFIPAAAAPLWPALAPALRQRPILTISDSPPFPTQGGMIAITTPGGAPSLAIRPEIARQASLTLSAKLLSLRKFVTVLN